MWIITILQEGCEFRIYFDTGVSIRMKSVFIYHFSFVTTKSLTPVLERVIVSPNASVSILQPNSDVDNYHIALGL